MVTVNGFMGEGSGNAWKVVGGFSDTFIFVDILPNCSF